MLQYHIIAQPHSHQWQICIKLEQNSNTSLQLSLPNWVPGSYLIRDFSRHIIQINATCNNETAEIRQISKNHWQTEARAGAWQICYTVYAYDLSVRGAYLTCGRAFFDGACLFLSVGGREHEPHQVIPAQLPADWQTATTLPRLDPNTFQAASYAELIDHPVEFGNIETLTFTAGGIPHRIAISGHYADFDRERLVGDIQKICTAELAMYPEPAPFQEYLFLLHVGDKLYGGLEHRSSTALLADRNSLPASNMAEPNDDYIQLLGLFSHEYFHAWNVKSIKPAAFTPYQLDQESYTEQLWAFEGITSYYDDLFLARSGVISPETYLKLLAQTITRVQQGKGRLKQTLAESSFSAWHKFYKQDENSPNAIVSYYQKGALAALCLDLLIRRQSSGAHSLDSVMQQLYRDWFATGAGIAEQQWQVRCQQITGLNLHDFFQTALYSTEDLPLNSCLQSVGVALQWQPEARSHGGGLLDKTAATQPAADFGARYTQNGDSITLTHVFNGGSAENAALCPQDRIIALNGFACTAFDKQWATLKTGSIVPLHYFRHGVLQQTELQVQAAEADTALLSVTDNSLLQQWLGYNTVSNP
ncbi:M61 family peptidase [Uruburuella testudinis]|uniref:M61 family peptidase n=1 Tax=Uruburuella testudinis TaxID=1282863 RepID=A0ABY4DV20_9NEIS|nr:M61 family peptidase [Uruburuella testudinis]UOO82515.1 M61 family peptidase [Uruburuella testudinis]